MSDTESEMFDRLNNALDVKKDDESTGKEVVLSKDEKNAEDDYQYAKDKLKEIIDQSEQVLEHAADIATETGEPRSIEVYSGLAKTMGDLAKAVLDNNKIKSSIDKDRGTIKNPKLEVPEGGSITQNNQTIFVGTTKELHDMLNAEDDEVIENEPEGK